MKIAGIVAEYNPFHNGHKYHIEATRKALGATHIAVVMSGNFVQRGNLSLFSKWCRAKLAVQNGADLVIELPSVFSCAPAKDFAYAGVYLLDKLGVQVLSFGSECGDKELLAQTATFTKKARETDYFKALISDGISYPKASELAVCEHYGEKYSKVLTSPNNLLGIEYINAINKQNLDLEILTLSRNGVKHDDSKTSKNFASASFIREKILNGKIDEVINFLPENAYKEYLSEIALNKINDITFLEDIIFYKLRTSSIDSLCKTKYITSELASRLLKFAKQTSNLEKLIELSATRRYSKANVRRALINTLLENENGKFAKKPQYARVLALNEKGMEIIRSAKEKNDFVISPKFADIYKTGFSQAEYEAKATDIYCLAFKDKECNLDFTKTVYVEK